MTATTTENYEAATEEADFLTADEPPGDETAGQDAPYGWTRDEETGELRPKKRAGRPKRPPSAEELAQQPPVERGEDHPPRPPSGRREPAELPMPKGGIIAKGVNRLYFRAGKILRAMDHDLGQAVIECTRKEDDDDLTVGEAWEALCKTNPRIRRFVLNCLRGGAWGDLILAHAPIGIALMMKPAVMRFLPLRRFAESMAEPDENTPEGEGDLPGGMTAADVGDLHAMAEDQARRVASKMGVRLSEHDLAEARAAAERLAGDGIPPGLRRKQPQNRSRAARRGR